MSEGGSYHGMTLLMPHTFSVSLFGGVDQSFPILGNVYISNLIWRAPSTKLFGDYNYDTIEGQRLHAGNNQHDAFIDDAVLLYYHSLFTTQNPSTVDKSFNAKVIVQSSKTFL